MHAGFIALVRTTCIAWNIARLWDDAAHHRILSHRSPPRTRTADGMGCAGLEHAGLEWAGLHGLAVAKLVAKPVIGMR